MLYKGRRSSTKANQKESTCVYKTPDHSIGHAEHSAFIDFDQMWGQNPPGPPHIIN